MTVAVIADIVGSRALADRREAQRTIEAVMREVDHDLPVAVVPFAATVGDEFQAVYPSIDDALRGILLVQLALPDGIALRFGLGVGDIHPLDTGSGAPISDGPGWWAARSAIDEVHRMQRRDVPAARSWTVGSGGEDEAMLDRIALANAYALARDGLVGAMSARVRRLVRGRCLSATQRDLAEAEGISQPAVSQALAASGAAAVVAGFVALAGRTPRPGGAR